MSIWHNAKEIDIDAEQREFDLLINTDIFGNVYCTVSFEQVRQMAKDLKKLDDFLDGEDA